MTHHALLQSANHFSPLEGSDAAYFLSLFEEKHFKRNAILLKEGEVAHEVFFVKKGSLRQCFVNEDGAERTCNFAFENEFITDLESFSRQSKAATNIVALESTTCYVTTCVAVATAMKNSKGIADFFRAVVERVAEDGIRRTKSMLSFSPERQFEDLIAAKPGLLQRVPQRYIAQYLGIAPESLSRIRKRMMSEAKP